MYPKIAQFLAIAGLLSLVGCPLSGVFGCTQPDAQIALMMQEVVGPAIEKAASEVVTRTAQMSGTLTGVNPGYSVEFEGKWVTGVEGKFTIFLDGVSATIMASGQADRSADPPFIENPTTENVPEP